MDSSCFLLKIRDEAVVLLQNVLIILGKYYEDTMRSNTLIDSFSSPNLEVVQLTYHTMSAIMASLWPCDKQFVAVFGPTGCGKSTILNVILSMMCSTGVLYEQGIKADSGRVVLRETAKTNWHYALKADDGLEQSADGEDSVGIAGSEELDCKYLDDETGTADISNERLSVGGLLGICCAQNRELYMNKHLPLYDEYPFLLQNGRMGDAGTIKVTAIEHGPKFAGYIRWISKKKLRKQFRELRQLLEKDTCDEREKTELEELWRCILEFVDELPHVRPDEERINRVISALENRVQLGKEEVIQMDNSKGSTVDRIVVRDGILRKLQHQKGQLAEDIRIEVPVASFEGGIGFLDVPGTNDPRVLHQRETRDAIGRTSLILLILDKSVIDEETQKVLEESPILERMLLDENAVCSLTVVGIAEKGIKKNQLPKELIMGFDPKHELKDNLEKIFRNIARRLFKSRRISKEDARQRVENLFWKSNRISVLPVLPLLCASIHLSASNAALHDMYCESQGKSNCPLLMSKKDRMEKCLETNMPQLIDKVHSVRMPPNVNELRKSLADVKGLLSSLTDQTELNAAFVDFLRREDDHAKSIDAESLLLTADIVAVNDEHVQNILDLCKEESVLTLDDIEFVKSSLNSKVKVKEMASHLRIGGFHVGPIILRGFRPDVIGERAQQLIKPVDEASREFIKAAFQLLQKERQGFARQEATVDMDSRLDLGKCIALYEQVEKRWELSLDRLRAKYYCGGINGGLLGQMRLVLRRSYDQSIKQFFMKLQKQSSELSLMDTVTRQLYENQIAKDAAETAKKLVLNAINDFSGRLLEQTTKEIRLLWRTWQKEINKLGVEAANAVNRQLVAREGGQPCELSKGGIFRDHTNFREKLHDKELELEKLLHDLSGNVKANEARFHYGYSLLQSDPDFGLSRTNEPSSQQMTPTADLTFGGCRLARSSEVSNVTGGNYCGREGAPLEHDCHGQDGRLLSPRDMHKHDGNPVISPRSSNLEMRNPDGSSLVGDTFSRHSCGGQDSGQFSPKAGVAEQASPRNKLSSVSKVQRKAVVLSEAESHKLQVRESFTRKKLKR